jgi:hypothetical protein
MGGKVMWKKVKFEDIKNGDIIRPAVDHLAICYVKEPVRIDSGELYLRVILLENETMRLASPMSLYQRWEPQCGGE